MSNRKWLCRNFVMIIMIFPLCTFAQKTKKERKGEFYFSWGYNTEWYTKSTVSISQPSLGNSYTFNSVYAHDHKGWDNGLFTQAVSIPQYNYRIGYIIDKKKNLGIEINFDHTKYIIGNAQTIHVKGEMDHKPIDGPVYFADSVAGSDSSSYYYLNNGANFLLINVVKRWPLYVNKKQTIKIDGFGKFGIGPVIPHVQNKFFNQPENNPNFQIGGWNMGVEGAIRATFFHNVYLEYTNKLDYARYTNLQIYQGTAKQAFGTYEMILNLGFSFPVGKVVN